MTDCGQGVASPHVDAPSWVERAPARRLAIVRIAVCGFATGYLIVRSPHLWAVTRLGEHRYDPVGIVSMLTSGPTSSWVVAATIAGAVLTGVAATAGWRHRWTGPAFAALLWWTLSYRLSWGQVLHTENLLVFHAAVLGLSRSADTLSLDARRSIRRSAMPAEAPLSHQACVRYGWALQLMSLITALTYVIAAWAKLRNGGLDWMTGDVLRSQIAYDNLRKLQLGDVHSGFGGWLTQFRWLFPPIAAASMLIELSAPVIAWPNWRGRLQAMRGAWVISALAFHYGVLALMAILFPYQLFVLAFLSCLPVERALDRVMRRRSTPGATSPAPDSVGATPTH